MKTTNTTQNTQNTQNTQDIQNVHGSQNDYKVEAQRLYKLLAYCICGISLLVVMASFLAMAVSTLCPNEMFVNVSARVAVTVGLIVWSASFRALNDCQDRLDALDQASADTDASPANEAEEVLS